MIYSYRIEEAIRAASVLHKDQVRKGRVPYPYISHLYAVATLVGDYTDNEDTVIGALLHDTLEDTDYSPDELENDFGKNVRKIVEGVSEHLGSTYKKEESWKERKKHYSKLLAEAPEASLIISAADKIHNMRSVIEEYYENHKRFIIDFKGSLKDRVLVYQEISNILNRRLKNDIIHEFNHVFDEYKKFIIHVQKETGDV